MTEVFTPSALSAKRLDASALFLKFTSLIDKYGENATYCFVEGYDMPYYNTPVKITIGKEPVPVDCHGKLNVIKINKYIEQKEQYSHYTKRYFVDQDYVNNDDIPQSIYITKGYAIENYYLSDICLSGILKNEFKTDEINDFEIYTKCINFYHEQHSKFEDAILLLNAWYCCLINMASWNRQDVSLDDSFPSEWLNCKIGNFTPSYTLEDIKKKYPSAPDIPMDEIEKRKIELTMKGWYFMRGKYEIQFLFTFLKYLKDEPKKSRKYTVKSCSIPFYQSTLVSTFSQYADIPDDLLFYIKTGTR